jgi:hypothetical protein
MFITELKTVVKWKKRKGDAVIPSKVANEDSTITKWGSLALRL